MEQKYINHPLYNSRIIKNYIQLIKRNYTYINIDVLLSYAKMERYQVEDEGHWFTQEQIDLFYEKLVKLTGNPNIAREAGRYAASPDTIGLMREYAIGLIGPAKVYEMVGRYANKFTKSSLYESKRIGRNKVEITVKPFRGVQEKPFQCENRKGFWEAISLLFNNRLPKIDHPECIFNGSDVCRYVISWQGTLSDSIQRIRNCTFILFFLFTIFSFFMYSEIFYASLFFTIIVTAIFSFWSILIRNKELNFAINNLREGFETVLEEIQINYNQASLVNEISHALSKEHNIKRILSETIKILQNRLDYDRGMILLAEDEKTELIFQTGFGYDFEQFHYIKNINFHLDKPESKGPFVKSFREQIPILVNDIEEISSYLTPKSLDFARKVGTKSFICCPIIYGNESLGILAVDNVKTKRPLRERDVNLLMGTASEIGISINNAKLLELKERQFQSTLKALAASIDARDTLTKGHSERVAEYAVGICRELGMSEDFTETVRIAALLHDYGKIGVPDSILKKDGPLTPEEYEEIKSHVIKTEQIINQIEFDKKYTDIMTIITGHHEKLDGSGYPKGLSGEKIPLGAKIIAVADFFDAITSKRHYRESFPLDEAFNFLIEKRGVHYDEVVVDAFIRFYTKTYRKIYPKHNKLILN